MEFEVTGEQLHCEESGAFSPGTSADRRASTSSLFAHISHAQEGYAPLRQATTKIHELYKRCNPSFGGSGATSTRVPARVLTQPSEPLSEAVPYDNKEGNLIARVYDVIEVPGASYHYTVMDLLGTGTFGQVFRCLKEPNEDVLEEGGERMPSEVVAVKVVKGKPAYRTQGLLEVKIAKMVNQLGDPEDRHHLVRVKDSFESRGHVCIVFELLSCSLLDVLTQNQFRGLPLEVVQRFTVQLLSALAVLQDTNIIHCDLKPENILLCPKAGDDCEYEEESCPSPASPSHKGAVDIKVIDFGSACFEGKTMYSYIQSRFYRSPEVLLGVPYNGAIDIWSLGCVCAEMYLGLPLFPGASQHNQLTRIVDMLGNVPDFLVEHGKNSEKFFVQVAPSAPLPSYSLLPSPFSLPPPHYSGTRSGEKVKASTSLGSILPAALRDGGMQVSSFMNTLVSGPGGSSRIASQSGVSSSDDNSLRKDNLKKHSTNHSHNFRLKSAEEYASANNQQVPTFRKYLRYDKLDDIVMKCPLPSGTSGHMSSEQKKKEHYRRKCFLDFLKGLLHLNPFDRLTARQAMEHPFVAKYFNKKSKIGTVRVKVSSTLSSPSHNRTSRSGNVAPDSSSKNANKTPTPEFVEKRIFLPPYDEKVRTRVSNYQSKMEEALSYVVSPSHLMGRNNVCLSTMKKADNGGEQGGATSGTGSAVGAPVGANEAGVVNSDNSSLNVLLTETANLFAKGSLSSDVAPSDLPVKSGYCSTPDKLTQQVPDVLEKRGHDSDSKNPSSQSSSSDPPPPLHPNNAPSLPAAQDLSFQQVNRSSTTTSGLAASPGGLMSALLQANPPTNFEKRNVMGSHIEQPYLALNQQQSQNNSQYHYSQQDHGYVQPPPPPSSLASSYGSPGGMHGVPTANRDNNYPNLMSHSNPTCTSSTIPIPMPQSLVDFDHAEGKLTGNPLNDSSPRRRQSGSGMSRSTNSALGSMVLNGGAPSTNSLSSSFSSSVFNSGSSFEFGNFVGGGSSNSSMSNDPSFPSTPTRQQSAYSPAYTPTSSFNTPAGAFLLGSPTSSSTNEYGQALQRPELDESRYLQSFGFQQHLAKGNDQTRRYDRSHSISESTYTYPHSHSNAAPINYGKNWHIASGGSSYNNPMTSSGSWSSVAGLAAGVPGPPDHSSANSWSMTSPPAHLGQQYKNHEQQHQQHYQKEGQYYPNNQQERQRDPASLPTHQQMIQSSNPRESSGHSAQSIVAPTRGESVVQGQCDPAYGYVMQETQTPSEGPSDTKSSSSDCQHTHHQSNDSSESNDDDEPLFDCDD